MKYQIIVGFLFERAMPIAIRRPDGIKNIYLNRKRFKHCFIVDGNFTIHALYEKVKDHSTQYLEKHDLHHHILSWDIISVKPYEEKEAEENDCNVAYHSLHSG